MVTEDYSTNQFEAELQLNDVEGGTYVPVLWNGREMVAGGDFSEQEIDWLMNVALANLKRVYGRDLIDSGTTVIPYQSVENPVAVIQPPLVPSDTVLAIKPVNREAYYIAYVSYDAQNDVYLLEPYVLLHDDESLSMPIYVNGAVVDDGNIWTSADIDSLGTDIALTVSYYYGVNASYLSNNEESSASNVPVPHNIIEV